MEGKCEIYRQGSEKFKIYKRSSEILADKEKFCVENVLRKIFTRLFLTCCAEIGGMLHSLRRMDAPEYSSYNITAIVVCGCIHCSSQA